MTQAQASRREVPCGLAGAPVARTVLKIVAA